MKLGALSAVATRIRNINDDMTDFGIQVSFIIRANASHDAPPGRFSPEAAIIVIAWLNVDGNRNHRGPSASSRIIR